MNLKALIFDVDGTLADTEEAHRRAFNAAFARHRLDWNWSKPQYAQLLATTGGKERIAVYIDSLNLSGALRAALIEQIAALHLDKTQIYTRIVAAGEVPLRDGVLRLLDEARAAHIHVAIASTTTLANIEALLQTALGSNALERFAAVGAGDRVPRKKPAPDIYEWVMREMRLEAPACVAIEDSNNGLMAAKAAGLFTVITPSYWTRGENFSAADLVLPSLGSVERPLVHRAAELIGSPYLGVRQLIDWGMR